MTYLSTTCWCVYGADAITVGVLVPAAARVTRAGNRVSGSANTSAVVDSATSLAIDRAVINLVPDVCRAVISVSVSAVRRVRPSVVSVIVMR